jgi:hypothetical protein
MKYSLNSLMIAVTLCCVLAAIAGRCFYLHRMAVFHDQEAMRFGLAPHVSDEQDYEASVHFAEHVFIARRYRAAIWHPWTSVDTTPPADADFAGKMPNSAAPAPNPPKK